MTGKQKGIMGWIIVWAGLLIVVLYSPVGSPELYSSQNYSTEYQNIGFKKGEILNAPKVNSSTGTTSDEPDMPDLNLETKSNYSIRNVQSATSTSQGSFGSVKSQSYQNSNATGGNLSGSGTTVLANRSSGKSEGSSGIIMTNGMATLSTTTNLSTTTSRQSVNADAPLGGTDPGSDPTGPPIPVGDGWGLLVLFGCAYALIKSKYRNNLLQKTAK